MPIATSVGPRPGDGRDAGSQSAVSDAVIGTFVYGDVELRLHAHSGAVARKLARETYARPRKLPPQPFTPPAYFVGRAQELASVVHPIAAGGRVLVELTGREGIGKTTFIRQLMMDPALAVLDGVVRLEGGVGREDALQRVFDAAFEGERHFMPLGIQRETLLAEPRLLVIFDDFAGTEEDAAYLAESLPKSSFIFVTDRPRLGSLATAVALPALNTDDAQALSARTKGDKQTLDSAASLTAILSATPLEIVQAATVPRDAGEPQATGDLLLDQLATTISATENVLLSALVVTGGGPLGAKMIGRLAGLPNAMPMLESLERRGLVDFDGERYRLRPTILERVPVQITMPRLDGSLAVFEEWLRGNPTEAQIVNRAQAVNRLLARAIEDNRTKEVVLLGPMLANALILAGQPDRARATLDIVLKAARAIPDRDVEAWALHQSGTIAFVLDDEVAGQTLLSRALEIRSRLSDELATAATRHNLSMVLGVKPSAGTGEDPAAAAKRPNRLVIAVIFAFCAGLAVLFALKLFAQQQAPEPFERPIRHAAPRPVHRDQPESAPAPAAPGAGAAGAAHAARPQEAPHHAAPKPKVKHRATPRPAAPPSISAFYPNPATSAAGEYAQLCFTIGNATSASIDGIGSVPARGSHCITIKPERSETYTLTASNAASSTRAYTTLSVTATTQVRPE